MEYTTIIIETADLITKGIAPLVAAGIASAIPGIAKGIGSLFGGRKRRREERRAQGERNRAMRSFEQMQFTNPYADMTNPYADIENRMEDLRVGTQAAEFTTEQQQQQLSNVLEQFRDVGGGTGGAAVATALARQSSRNVQMAAANIEQQELRNEQMAAQAGMQLDLQGAKGEQTRQLYTSKGESERQQLEMGKRSQILGLANQELAGAKAARAQAKSDLIGGIGSAASAAFSAFGPAPTDPKPGQIVGKNMFDRIGMATKVGLGQGSRWNRFFEGRNTSARTKGEINDWMKGVGMVFSSDRRLKKNIKLIRKSKSGLNIYIFEYINKIFGEGIYQGVMSDEIPQYAVIKHTDGYDRVDYSKIDIEFKQLIK